MPTGLGAVKRLWWGWKSLRLPWRKKWLVGFDLAGNTFWEFKDALNANRLRRIVHYNRNAHHADIKISPSWIQWLRHTRYEAPTISEQRLDVHRQAQIKQLAAQADARWAAQVSYLQPPVTPTSEPANKPASSPSTEDLSVVDDLVTQTEDNVQQMSEEIQGPSKPKRAKKEVRWEELKLGRSDSEQQPEPWIPRPVKRG